jgi:glycosyltransferase involved in cell wall biosynthesis
VTVPRPDVSVVIPTHDRIDLLKQTLESVLAQVDVEMEVIVVDDGSSRDVASLLVEWGDDRFRLLRNDVSMGVSAARNRGIEAASASWVACVDDDDLWAPDKLRSQLDAAAAAGRSWVYAGAVNISPRLRVVAGAKPMSPEEVVSRIRSVNVVPGGASGVLMRRDLALRVGGFDREFHHFADWDLWMRLAEEGPPAWVARPLMAYRVHQSNMAVRGAGDVDADLRLFSERGLSVDRTPIYRWLGWWARRGGRPIKAIRYLARAWRVNAGDYSFGEMMGDSAYIARESAERFRLRYLKRMIRRPLISGRPGGDPMWIAEAEQWVEPLRNDLRKR